MSAMGLAAAVNIEDLPQTLAESVSAEERALIQKLKTSGLSFAVTRHFASLAGPDKDDPIRRQFMPDPREERLDTLSFEDPLGEALFRVTPRLVHQYPDRVLLLAGGNCAGFCRYCFRRVRMSSPSGFIGAEELAPVLSYIKSRPGIKEVLVSGGDPLTACDGDLEDLLVKLRQARPDIMIRICSRIPITNPERITAETISLFARFKPLKIVTHINHPRELAQTACQVFAGAVDAGIPVQVQTVLLRGINDKAEILAELFGRCLNLGLSLYYLFQLDPAPGIAHFRVPLKEGLSIYNDLKNRYCGKASGGTGGPDLPEAPLQYLPVYALDLPGGGGKIALSESVIAGNEDCGKALLLRGPDGKLWRYPSD